MKLGVWLLVACFYCCAAWSNTSEESSTSRRGFQSLLPKFNRIAPIAAQQIELKESLEQNLSLLGRSRQNPVGIAMTSRVRQYVSAIKKYTQLKLTDNLAVTVGSVKSRPISIDEQQVIEVDTVFDSKMNADDTARGYGLKFKLDL